MPPILLHTTETILNSPGILLSLFCLSILILYIILTHFFTLVWFEQKSRKFLNYTPYKKILFALKQTFLKKLNQGPFNQKQRFQIVEQMPAFLQALSNTLKAGYSLTNAFSFLSHEVPMPLQKELQLINQKLNSKIPLPQVLQSFAKNINQKDIDFFVESTCLQLKTGGNLILLFKKIGTNIEEKLKIKRDLEAYTSQGKLSGLLMAGLWPISLLFFYFASPNHIDILFHTSAGNILLGLSLFLECLGFLFIWKIMHVKI